MDLSSTSLRKPEAFKRRRAQPTETLQGLGFRSYGLGFKVFRVYGLGLHATWDLKPEWDPKSMQNNSLV